MNNPEYLNEKPKPTNIMKQTGNNNETRLKLIDISKTFPGVKALDGVDMEIVKGEVHALCGENGAGKSTLMNILSGNLKPDTGKIVLDGQEVVIENQKHAQELGISIVYQERSLVHTLSVAENIFSGNQPVNRFGFIDNKALHTKTKALLEELELQAIHPKALVEHLSPGSQQMVEIAKALSQNPDILILDEPTASITETEVNILFKIIRRLIEKGVTVIYISHRMSEIFEISHRISILKDGMHQGTFETSQITVNDVIRLMVGRELVEQQYVYYGQDEVMLEVQNLSGQYFQKVSFNLKKGEILGLAGLVGAGRTEVARAIFGADPVTSGKVIIGGKMKEINHPNEGIKSGIGYVSEERKDKGLFLDMTLQDNLLSANLPAAAHKGFINAKKMGDVAREYVQKLRIKTPGIHQKVLNLSGGNQQKVVLAKWLLVNPKILIVDEPTHGVDVGAKAEIYEILRSLAKQGTAIILISSELPEILTLCDRILVMCLGRLTGELSREEATEQEIMHYASGTKTIYSEAE